MAILSKVPRPLLSQVRVLYRNPAVTRLVLTKPAATTGQSYKVQPACNSISTFPALYKASEHETKKETQGLTQGLGMVFEFNYQTMPVAYIMEPYVLDKLVEYSTIPPTPISIEKFLTMGAAGAFSEENSYSFLKREVAVRLAHMIMELQHLPRELHAEERCHHTISLYSQSFSQIIEFEERVPDKETLGEFMMILKTFKIRHKDTVPDMALACTTMKERLSIPKDEVSFNVFTSIKTFLDRLYTSRISIHMITNQHLAVYGYERTPPNQIGIIHPNTCISSILMDAYDDALTDIENCYMVAPKVNIKNHNSSNLQKNEPSFGVLVPSHLYIVFYEVLKNAMRATVEFHWDSKANLPPIEVLICQANDDFTIKISDRGGGVDRVTSYKIFDYLYSTDSKHSESDKSLGYGLPLARLYTRYFHGDLRVAAYEGYGSDVYIYTKALASTAVERLPVYNKESVEDRLAEHDLDWSSSIGKVMMQAPEKIAVAPEVVEIETHTVQPKP